MKKFLCMFLCMIMALGTVFVCDAKTITTQTNTSESSAPTLEEGDTAVIYGELYSGTLSRCSKYYKFTMPFNGNLTVHGRATVSKVTSDDYTYYSVIIYNQSFKNGSFPLYLKTSKSTSSSDSFDISLPKGEYILDIAGNYSFGSIDASPPNKDTTLYLSLSFECSHIETTEEIKREPTCSKEGLINIVCTDCKEVIDTEDIEKTDHTPADEWETITEVSCSEEGKEVLYCTVCEEEIDEKTHKKLPHTFGDWEVTKEANCAKEGERVRTCSVCKEKETEELSKPDHKFSKWEVTKEATCSEEGERVRTCSACGEKETEETEKPEHTLGKWETIKEATCKAKGEKQSTCKVCNKTVSEDIEKLDHKFSKWKTEKEATEQSAGKKLRTCSLCGEEETETIAKLVHGAEYEWKTTKKESCTQSGTKIKVCDYCGKTIETQTIKATGHDFGDWEIEKEPTKTSKGVEVRECEECSYEESRSVSLIHGDYGEWQVTEKATCDKKGTEAFICRCCGKSTKTRSIAKLDHSYSEWIEEQSAVPERNGKDKRTCTLCGNVENRTRNYDFEGLKKKPEKDASFRDVDDGAWYKGVVNKVFHYGLMVGNSETTFNPQGNISVAEVITAAVRVHCLFNDGEKPDLTKSPWYQGYVDYAIANGIINEGDFTDYTKTATRAEMAYVFSNCASDALLEAINETTSIPDVSENHRYYKAILKLYNAGILSGNDEKGTFAPENNITRAEAAAIISRISNISDRIKKQKKQL